MDKMDRVIYGIRELEACPEAIKWLRGQPDVTTAWNNCERGDWMLWLVGKLSGQPGSEARKKLVLAACGCARLSLKYIPADEVRPLKAIQTAESWGRGDNGVTIQDVHNASAAYAASDASAAYASASAAYAASAIGRAHV